MPARPRRDHRDTEAQDDAEDLTDILFDMDDAAPLLPASTVEAWQTVMKLRGYSDVEPEELGSGAWRVVATIPHHRRDAALNVIKEDVEWTVFAMCYDLIPPGVAVQVDGTHVYASVIIKKMSNQKEDQHD